MIGEGFGILEDHSGGKVFDTRFWPGVFRFATLFFCCCFSCSCLLAVVMCSVACILPVGRDRHGDG